MLCSIVSCASLALLLSATAAPSASAPTSAPTQHELLQRLGSLQGLSARYREEKTMGLLAAPLVSEGVLYFAPPGRLARHQARPTKASVVIDGDDLRFGDARGSERIDLDRNPVVRLFVQTFVQILAGDETALSATYRIAYEPGDDGAWSMTLRPKVSPIDRMIERIELRGQGVELSAMEIIEVGGDKTVTTFEDVDPERTFTKAELRDLFRIPG